MRVSLVATAMDHQKIFRPHDPLLMLGTLLMCSSVFSADTVPDSGDVRRIERVCQAFDSEANACTSVFFNRPARRTCWESGPVLPVSFINIDHRQKERIVKAYKDAADFLSSIVAIMQRQIEELNKLSFEHKYASFDTENYFCDTVAGEPKLAPHMLKYKAPPKLRLFDGEIAAFAKDFRTRFSRDIKEFHRLYIRMSCELVSLYKLNKADSDALSKAFMKTRSILNSRGRNAHERFEAGKMHPAKFCNDVLAQFSSIYHRLIRAIMGRRALDPSGEPLDTECLASEYHGLDQMLRLFETYMGAGLLALAELDRCIEHWSELSKRYGKYSDRRDARTSVNGTNKTREPGCCKTFIKARYCTLVAHTSRAQAQLAKIEKRLSDAMSAFSRAEPAPIAYWQHSGPHAAPVPALGLRQHQHPQHPHMPGRQWC
ncbi:hypothetical protein PAPHI01_2299 [Pancytospora philotis]|nr:hypothetical protein PAPHI01_2299 [Pancytospora philotis]